MESSTASTISLIGAKVSFRRKSRVTVRVRVRVRVRVVGRSGLQIGGWPASPPTPPQCPVFLRLPYHGSRDKLGLSGLSG